MAVAAIVTVIMTGQVVVGSCSEQDSTQPPARTHCAHCTHALCTRHKRTVHTAQTHCAHCTNALCTLHVRSVHTARRHCAHCTQALCTLHARTVHTPLTLSVATPLGIMVWIARAAHWFLRCAVLSVATPLGIMVWIARAAHWFLRCAVRQQLALPTHLWHLSAWIKLVEQVGGWQ